MADLMYSYTHITRIIKDKPNDVTKGFKVCTLRSRLIWAAIVGQLWPRFEERIFLEKPLEGCLDSPSQYVDIVPRLWSASTIRTIFSSPRLFFAHRDTFVAGGFPNKPILIAVINWSMSRSLLFLWNIVFRICFTVYFYIKKRFETVIGNNNIYLYYMYLIQRLLNDYNSY